MELFFALWHLKSKSKEKKLSLENALKKHIVEILVPF